MRMDGVEHFGVLFEQGSVLDCENSPASLFSSLSAGPTTRLPASSSSTLLVYSGIFPRHFPPTSMEEINSSLEHMKFFMDADDNDIDTRQNLKFCMFRKLFSNKSPNLAALFKFFCEADMRRVEQTGPWCFNENILLLHRWEHEVSPYEISFKETTIWVQFLGLLLEWYTPQFVRKLSMNIGEVLEIDLGKDTGYSFKAAKARIKFNLENPLKPDRIWRLEGMTVDGGLPLISVSMGNRKPWLTPLTTKVPLSQSYKPSQRERFLEAPRRKQEDGNHQKSSAGFNTSLRSFSEVEPMDISVRTQDDLQGLTGEARSKEEKSGIQLATHRLEALKGMDNGLGLGVKPNSLKADMDPIKSAEPIPLTSPALYVENYPTSYSASQGKIEDVCSSIVINNLSKHGKRHLNENKIQRSAKLRQDNRYKPYTRKAELKNISNNLFNYNDLTDVQITEGHVPKGEQASLKMPHQPS
ncbi:hypothetical protein FNV43_RR19491 [Rhamnella rubrinervis]|uniref:DUF4283 domain-containing protein n=1 Tax=Rhamnella rubrinervis TaxID=2594499 RepID=A0A8K0DSS0_9ROSA|nr:hypothetical protein FNV43_RR19491 [Rhamnella rubrinervis]